jgi:hypothetical protein
MTELSIEGHFMRFSKAVLMVSAVAATMSMPVAAAEVLNVTMEFASGAAFTGSVTFADDFSSYSAVDGELVGYQNGVYTGIGSTPINWVWDSSNRSTGQNNFSNWLMGPGPQSYYDTYIQLAYNYADPANLTFTSGVSEGGTDNFINYRDAFVSGSFSSVEAAVPEPATWAMMLIGFGFVGGAMRSRRHRKVTVSYA